MHRGTAMARVALLRVLQATYTCCVWSASVWYYDLRSLPIHLQAINEVIEDEGKGGRHSDFPVTPSLQICSDAPTSPSQLKSSSVTDRNY